MRASANFSNTVMVLRSYKAGTERGHIVCMGFRACTGASIWWYRLNPQRAYGYGGHSRIDAQWVWQNGGVGKDRKKINHYIFPTNGGSPACMVI